jgi:aminoglycoside 3-N-acetyltransferase
MIHASLRRSGLNQIPEGAQLLVQALDEAVGPSGTLMMLLGTHYPMDWVNLRPIAERAELLAGSAPFDPVTAPVYPEAGALAEVFRLTPGTIVNANPSGRFGARGRLADALLSDGPWDDYYGPGSPLERLFERGGRILRIGANPDTVTALHYAEYVADIPGKRRTRWDYVLAGAGGPRHCWVQCLDDNDGIAPWDGEDYFALILKAYLETGRARRGMIGTAASELIEAGDIIQFGARWMEQNLVSG